MYQNFKLGALVEREERRGAGEFMVGCLFVPLFSEKIAHDFAYAFALKSLQEQDDG